jgi:hypothetical protein
MEPEKLDKMLDISKHSKRIIDDNQDIQHPENITNISELILCFYVLKYMYSYRNIMECRVLKSDNVYSLKIIIKLYEGHLQS